MAPRSSWKGYLKLSLVAVPVKAYNATSESRSIQLNQLHEECHSRIRYQKTCPIHGEVSQRRNRIGVRVFQGSVRGRGSEPNSKNCVRKVTSRLKSTSSFPSNRLDAIYDTGRTYYLVPDGPVGQKPFALLRDAMQSEHCHAIAQVVISNREQLVRLRPVGKMVTMTVLNYATQVKQPSAFEDELIEPSVSDKELDLTRQLVQALLRRRFDIAAYHDSYTKG